MVMGGGGAPARARAGAGGAPAGADVPPTGVRGVAATPVVAGEGAGEGAGAEVAPAGVLNGPDAPMGGEI